MIAIEQCDRCALRQLKSAPGHIGAYRYLSSDADTNSLDEWIALSHQWTGVDVRPLRRGHSTSEFWPGAVKVLEDLAPPGGCITETESGVVE